MKPDRCITHSLRFASFDVEGRGHRNESMRMMQRSSSQIWAPKGPVCGRVNIREMTSEWERVHDILQRDRHLLPDRVHHLCGAIRPGVRVRVTSISVPASSSENNRISAGSWDRTGRYDVERHSRPPGTRPQ